MEDGQELTQKEAAQQESTTTEGARSPEAARITELEAQLARGRLSCIVTRMFDDSSV